MRRRIAAGGALVLGLTFAVAACSGEQRPDFTAADAVAADYVAAIANADPDAAAALTDPESAVDPATIPDLREVVEPISDVWIQPAGARNYLNGVAYTVSYSIGAARGGGTFWLSPAPDTDKAKPENWKVTRPLVLEAWLRVDMDNRSAPVPSPGYTVAGLSLAVDDGYGVRFTGYPGRYEVTAADTGPWVRTALAPVLVGSEQRDPTLGPGENAALLPSPALQDAVSASVLAQVHACRASAGPWSPECAAIGPVFSEPFARNRGLAGHWRDQPDPTIVVDDQFMVGVAGYQPLQFDLDNGDSVSLAPNYGTKIAIDADGWHLVGRD